MNFRGNSYGPMAPLPCFQGNLYGPMALKVRQKCPPRLVLGPWTALPSFGCGGVMWVTLQSGNVSYIFFSVLGSGNNAFQLHENIFPESTSRKFHYMYLYKFVCDSENYVEKLSGNYYLEKSHFSYIFFRNE